MEKSAAQNDTERSAESFLALIRAQDASGIVSRFSPEASLVVNGRKQDRIPFAGAYDGTDAVGQLLTRIFEAVEIHDLRPQFTLRDASDEVGTKIVCCLNLVGTVRSTGTQFDLEISAMVMVNGMGAVESARVFYDTDITRRAFEEKSDIVLRDEKGSGISEVSHAVSYDPKQIVPEIYKLIFEGVPKGTKVGFGDLARSTAEFARHNITKPPSFWWQLVRNFNVWDLSRQSAALRPYYSPGLIHMIKGGETEVELCGTYHGHQGLSDFALTLFSDLEYEGVPPQLETIAEGNRCAVHMPETFVNKATGTRAVVHMLHLWRFDDVGRVVEFKSYNDTFEIVHSYGLAGSGGELRDS